MKWQHPSNGVIVICANSSCFLFLDVHQHGCDLDLNILWFLLEMGLLVGCKKADYSCSWRFVYSEIVRTCRTDMLVQFCYYAIFQPLFMNGSTRRVFLEK